MHHVDEALAVTNSAVVTRHIAETARGNAPERRLHPAQPHPPPIRLAAQDQETRQAAGESLPGRDVCDVEYAGLPQPGSASTKIHDELIWSTVACWASSGVGNAVCVAAEQSLRECMDRPVSNCVSVGMASTRDSWPFMLTSIHFVASATEEEEHNQLPLVTPVSQNIRAAETERKFGLGHMACQKSGHQT